MKQKVKNKKNRKKNELILKERECLKRRNVKKKM